MDRLGGSSVIYMLLYSTPPLSSLHPHAPVLLRPLLKHPPPHLIIPNTHAERGGIYRKGRNQFVKASTLHTSRDRHFETGNLGQELLDRKLRVTGNSGRNF
jgi:hypothetical protein